MGAFLKNFDVVFCEGFRDSDYPKIIIATDGAGGSYSGEVVTRCILEKSGAKRPVIPVEVLEQIGKYITARLGR
jgi:molybdopterin-guanine dinucleotide biosynthesis protein